MAKKIYLSPSNQNANIYKYGNTNECVQCNRIADHAKKALERCGFNVKKAPQGQAMNTSISESNKWGADLHIPIHTNAYNGKVTGGTLVMLYSDSIENNKAGKAILEAVAPISPGSDYSLRYNSGLAELNSTNAMAVYLEVEFHDTTEGAKWIVENVEKIGEAIAKGVCKYYGVKYCYEKEDTKIMNYAVKSLLRVAMALKIIGKVTLADDAVVGVGTQKCLKEVQKILKLPQTGAIDEATVKGLNTLIQKKLNSMDGVVNLQKNIAGM